MELQPVAPLEAAEVAARGSKRGRHESPVATAFQPVAPLEAAEVAGEYYLSVHQDDHTDVVKTGFVLLRTYSATRKTYIGLRKDRDAADDRAMQLFDKGSSIEKSTLKLLRIQFSHRGLAHYATKVHGADAAFATMFYKIVYSNDYSGTDYGAWAFHGDLPLQQRAEDGQVLIASEWITR